MIGANAILAAVVALSACTILAAPHRPPPRRHLPLPPRPPKLYMDRDIPGPFARHERHEHDRHEHDRHEHERHEYDRHDRNDRHERHNDHRRLPPDFDYEPTDVYSSPKVYAYFKEPFPSWLRDITGLTQWPDDSPPYIPMDRIDLSLVPTDIPKRRNGDCSSVERTHCSFDCYRCVGPDDISTCPVISQTFDDGPSPSTPKLLQELPSKTTFFTQGINVIRFPETFRLQHSQGHLLGTHTWSHANLPSLSNEDIVAQIQWSIWAMNATASVVPRYFRPPYGAIDDRVRAITRQFDLVAVFWDRDTFDWKLNDRSKSEIEVFQEVHQWQSGSHGALILEHDSTIKTVNLGIEIAGIIRAHQVTVADCVGGAWYN